MKYPKKAKCLLQPSKIRAIIMVGIGGDYMEYIRRSVDDAIDKRIKAFNAINIVGPKGCGKTRTAKERCQTVIEFQDEEKRENLLFTAEASPRLFLQNPKPILFDEWQDAPKIWGLLRKECDDHPESTGEYYLTGSSGKKIKTPHSGTGRISTIQMYPMTLYETGESNGEISLMRLFNDDGYNIEGKKSALKLEDLFFPICRGGWPRTLSIGDKDSQLEIAKDYARQIYRNDISSIDNTDRNPELAATILKSYARNLATTAKKNTIYSDIKATLQVTDPTILSYVDSLKSLYVIKDLDAWTPQIRSKTAIRSAKKHIFIDPSIALAVLGVSPTYFKDDLDLFGHALENAVIRDLLSFASAHDASVKHYRDEWGLEADAVYQLPDGRYALIEIKTGFNQIAAAEKNLMKFDELIDAHNTSAKLDDDHPGVEYRKPSLKLIICATADTAITLDSGVKIIPVGCLKD